MFKKITAISSVVSMLMTFSVAPVLAKGTTAKPPVSKSMIRPAAKRTATKAVKPAVKRSMKPAVSRSKSR